MTSPFLGPIKDRRRNRNTACHVACRLKQVVLGHADEALFVDVLAIGDPQRFTHRRQVTRPLVLGHRIVNLDTQTPCGPAHMRLEDLTDIHPRRHAQGVQTEVHRRTIPKERHVLHRNNA